MPLKPPGSNEIPTHMTLKLKPFVLLGLIAAAAPVVAVPTPYGSPGTINPATYTFTAAADGEIVAYFVGQTAGYGSDIGLSINGADPLSFGLQNHAASSIYGAEFNMGTVQAGDVLRFVLRVSTSDFNGPPPVSYYLNSDASLNPNGENHVFSSSFAGDLLIPAGTYIGFEDISPLNDPTNDRDYDDHQFVFTNVRSTSSVPDGGATAVLLGIAVAGLAYVRRK